tara:strand:+ start:400 stop:741 length:342 start_codon:yes stop_codon:yes gene_type:complete
MQKYIKVTGLTNTVQVVNCNNILGIVRPSNTAFGITAAADELKIVYMDVESGTAEVSTFDIAATSTLAESVLMANYIKGLIAQVWEQPYTEPFLTIAGSDAPFAISLINPAGA